MKTFKNIRLVFSILLFTLMVSCNNEDTPSSSNSVSNVVNIAKSGTWRITYYYDTDHEVTNNFTGYNFTFGNSNVLTATNGTNTYTGTWSVTDSNSSDDSLNDLDFNILFSAPVAFQELSDDWEITENTASMIKLTDVSGGGGGTDFLTFTKN